LQVSSGDKSEHDPCPYGPADHSSHEAKMLKCVSILSAT
jgi:hypothetical protein